MNSQLSTRRRIRHFHIELSPRAVAMLTKDNDDLIQHYAEAWLAGENDHSSLMEYCDKVAGLMKGLAPIPEIKRELRNAIRQLERAGRGGF